MKNLPKNITNISLILMLTLSLTACPEWFKSGGGKKSSSGTTQTSTNTADGTGPAEDPPAADPPEDEPSATQQASTKKVIGSAGGTVMSPDGLLTLTFPAGAVGSDTEIIIFQSDKSELAGDTDKSNVTHVYRLEPDGLVFQQPVGASLVIPENSFVDSDGKKNFILSMLTTESSNGLIELLENQKSIQNKGDGTATVTGSLTHFTVISNVLLRFSNEFTDSIRWGAFTEDVQFVGWQEEGFIVASIPSAPDYKFGEVLLEMVAQFPLTVTGPMPSIFAPGSEIRDFGITCEAVATAVPIISRGTFFVNFGNVPVTLYGGEELSNTTQRFGFEGINRIDCITDPNPPVSQAPAYTLALGLIDVVIELLETPYKLVPSVDLAFISSIGYKPRLKTERTSTSPNTGFASYPFDKPVIAVTSGNSTRIMSLSEIQAVLDEEAVLDEISIPHGYGSTAASQSPLGPDSPSVIFHYGLETNTREGGSQIRNYCKDTKDFSCAQFVKTAGTVYDAQPIGGEIESPGITYANGDEISVIGFRAETLDREAGYEHKVGKTIQREDENGVERFGFSSVISAYQHINDGPVLVAVSSVFSNIPADDHLYLFETTSIDNAIGAHGVVTDIGALGLGARKLRCKIPLCVVINFGVDGDTASSLSIIKWDGTAVNPPVLVAPIIVGNAAAVAGLVDLDLVEVTDAEGTLTSIGVVTSGFNDGNIYEFQLDLDGTVLNQNNSAVPVECKQPGHSIWFPDSEGAKIVTTCYGSGHIVTKESLIFPKPAP